MVVSYFILAAVDKAAESISLWSMVMKGGWLMIPIFILSIIGIYIIFERYFSMQKAGKCPSNLTSIVAQSVVNGDDAIAIEKCEKENIPLTRVLLKGVRLSHIDMAELRTQMEAQASSEISVLEKGIAMLATVASLAPMIGFLGTVLGMVQAFYDMSVAGSNINISLLSRGIYTAMVTTVAGLIVGIIAQLGYNMLVGKINNIAAMLEKECAVFTEILYTRKK